MGRERRTGGTGRSCYNAAAPRRARLACCRRQAACGLGVLQSCLGGWVSWVQSSSIAGGIRARRGLLLLPPPRLSPAAAPLQLTRLPAARAQPAWALVGVPPPAVARSGAGRCGRTHTARASAPCRRAGACRRGRAGREGGWYAGRGTRGRQVVSARTAPVGRSGAAWRCSCTACLLVCRSMRARQLQGCTASTRHGKGAPAEPIQPTPHQRTTQAHLRSATRAATSTATAAAAAAAAATSWPAAPAAPLAAGCPSRRCSRRRVMMSRTQKTPERPMPAARGQLKTSGGACSLEHLDEQVKIAAQSARGRWRQQEACPARPCLTPCPPT